MATFIECDTPADLRLVSTADLPNSYACKLGNPADPDNLTWFFIDRNSTSPDDGDRDAGWSAIKCADGEGNWVVITPATYGLAAELNNTMNQE